jgi:hypothetical protein
VGCIIVVGSYLDIMYKSSIHGWMLLQSNIAGLRPLLSINTASHQLRQSKMTRTTPQPHNPKPPRKAGNILEAANSSDNDNESGGGKQCWRCKHAGFDRGGGRKEVLTMTRRPKMTLRMKTWNLVSNITLERITLTFLPLAL